MPLAVLVGVILAGRRRDRREAAHEQVRDAGRRVRIDAARRRGTSAAMSRDELFVLWSAARAEANMAYDAWCDAPGRIAYAVYRAAEDRADAAEVALSESAVAGARRRLTRGHRGNHRATACVVEGETGQTAGHGARMSVDELRFLLDGVPDTRELVIRRADDLGARARRLARRARGRRRGLPRLAARARRRSPTRPTAPRRTARTPRRTRSPPRAD